MKGNNNHKGLWRECFYAFAVFPSLFTVLKIEWILIENCIEVYYSDWPKKISQQKEINKLQRHMPFIVCSLLLFLLPFKSIFLKQILVSCVRLCEMPILSNDLNACTVCVCMMHTPYVLYVTYLTATGIINTRRIHS